MTVHITIISGGMSDRQLDLSCDVTAGLFVLHLLKLDTIDNAS